jgi:Zn-dependent M16 (insulinase) family peptidase
VDAAVEDLGQTLGDIPDASLSRDVAYLCDRMARDLAIPAQQTLNRLTAVLDLVRARDNARAFMIASTENCTALAPELDARLLNLSPRTSVRAVYGTERRVTQRLRQHSPEGVEPVYVGLMNENTRSGVFVNTAPCASYEDTDPEKALKFLSARLYGGGGAHSMFMKTWGAGLAYSNGLRSNESSGRLIYYAERCPDLAQTIQFVVDELKRAPYDTSLAEYAIAQAFSVFRSGSGYEQRGEAMAADLADGLTPEKVRRFRQGILAQRDRADLYDQLHQRMEATYGEVLPGYGPRGAEVKDAVYFVIGPEKQMQSYEQYLRGVEGPTPLFRLYPRDFWLVPAGE